MVVMNSQFDETTSSLLLRLVCRLQTLCATFWILSGTTCRSLFYIQQLLLKFWGVHTNVTVEEVKKERKAKTT